MPADAESTTALPNDAELIKRIKRGEDTAWLELCASYGPAITRYLCRLIKSTTWTKDDVDDLCQETFFRLARSRQRIELERPLKPLLKKIAFNVFRSWYARQKRKGSAIPLGPANEPAAFSEDQTNDGRMSEDLAAALERCIDRLPEHERQVVIRYHLDGVPLGEIARLLGITKNQAKHRSSDGTRKLAICLEEFR